MAPTMISTTRNIQASMSAQETVSASTSTRNVLMSTSIPEIMVTSTSSTRNEPIRRITITNAAPRRSVEMLPSIVIVEKGVCAICLEEWCKGDLATELPCKHKYHLECVEKWLKIHATCPQCRYVMSHKGENVVENVESSVDDDDEDSSSDSDSDE